MPLTRDQILSLNDIQIEEVDVPEWKDTVFVKSMTGMERDSFESSIIEIRGTSHKVNLVNARAKLVSLTACDKEGVLLFTEQDVKALGKKNAGALQRIFGVAQRLSGLSPEDVEELTEGLDKSPFEGSPSG